MTYNETLQRDGKCSKCLLFIFPFIYKLFVIVLQGAPQEVALWDWTNETEDAALMRKVIPSNDVQNTIKVDQSDNAELVTTGAKSVCFWTWMEDSLDVHIGKVSRQTWATQRDLFHLQFSYLALEMH